MYCPKNRTRIKFQLTRSRGAWHEGNCKTCCQGHFNSHAHVERDRIVGKNKSRKRNFNSHAHVERDIGTTRFSIKTKNFNSHAHVERDDRRQDKYFLAVHFNSHAHVERDLIWISAMWTILQFQLTRSRGAWLRSLVGRWFRHRHFNSHAHVERDRLGDYAPGELADFNSHAHVERDQGRCLVGWNLMAFQLTRSRGAWLWYDNIERVVMYFNSHAHVERDGLLHCFSTLVY